VFVHVVALDYLLAVVLVAVAVLAPLLAWPLAVAMVTTPL
jgi:hypothetical protein